MRSPTVGRGIRTWAAESRTGSGARSRSMASHAIHPAMISRVGGTMTIDGSTSLVFGVDMIARLNGARSDLAVATRGSYKPLTCGHPDRKFLNGAFVAAASRDLALRAIAERAAPSTTSEARMLPRIRCRLISWSAE